MGLEAIQQQEHAGGWEQQCATTLSDTSVTAPIAVLNTVTEVIVGEGDRVPVAQKNH